MKMLVLLLALPLAGCMTAAERIAQQQAVDDAKCKSYGAQQGSQPYIACRTQLDATRTQAQATIAAAPRDSGGITCNTFGHTTTCY